MSITDYELQGLGQSAKNAFRAVQDGDLATLKRFLGSVDINTARDTRGRTLLHVACLSDNRLMVAELLRAGADPCSRDRYKSTPLHLTVESPDLSYEQELERVGGVAIMRMLLSAGANVNAKDAWGETLLHAAAATRRCGCIVELLKAGADVNAHNYNGSTPLDQTLLSGLGIARSRVTSAQRAWPLLLSNGGVSNQNPMASVMNEDGFEYIRKIVTAGGFAAHAKAHRARLVATLVSKFTRIPADNIPLVVDFWAHVGFY